MYLPGLAIYDHAYVDFVGVWAASSFQDNIWVSPQSTNAQLALTGGTIFNAGTYGCQDPKTMCNGLTVNAGTFSLTGVAVRNNQGRGVRVHVLCEITFVCSAYEQARFTDPVY